MLLVKGKTSAPAGSPPAASPLAPIEAEVIALFVELARVLGQPRSYAEIYGLLFISARPLAMDDLIDRLGMSKGSASQGLRFLRNLGAIKLVYIPGDRRLHYEAVAQLRHLVTRFLRDSVVPHLDVSLERLEHVAKLVSKLPSEDRARVKERVVMLHSWEKKSRRFLGVVAGLLAR